MADPLATPQDIANVWRPLSDDEAAKATVLLQVASAIIRGKVPDLDARIASEDLDPVIPRNIAVEMVKRVLRNPKGVKQETAGPYEASYDQVGAAGKLILTDDELQLLQPEAPANHPGAGTIRVGHGFSPGFRHRGHRGHW